MPPLCLACNHHHDRKASCYRRDDRVFVPVPDGVTLADAEAALADAGAWVEVNATDDAPANTRIREEWTSNAIAATLRRWVRRDDLPPTDPDAELVEKMARAVHAADYGNRSGIRSTWSALSDYERDVYLQIAPAAIAVVREHEATR